MIYSAYGQRIACDWPLHLQRAAGDHRPDLSIVSTPASRFIPGRASVSPRDAKAWFQRSVLDDGSVYLRWRDLFEFQVSANGRRIDALPLRSASRSALETYLLGNVLSFALLKRGIEQFHATTVVVDGGAVAFLGDSGYGKSSLGAAFLQAGYNLLTDDMLVLARVGRRFYAHPGPPRIKMFPAMARRMLRRRIAGARMNPQTSKLIIPLAGSEQAAARVPLRALYVLNPPAASAANKVSIRRIRERMAFLKLLANCFNTTNLDAARLRNQFRLAHDLCQAVPVRALSYPRKLRSMPQVREAILADLRRLDLA